MQTRSGETLELGCPDRPEQVQIVVTTQDQSWVRVLLPGVRLTIGSGPDVDLCVPDPTVSAVHCSLRCTREGVIVEDLESKNGVRLAGARIHRAALICPGTEIVLGRTTVQLDGPAPGADEADWGLVGKSPAISAVRSAIRQFAQLSAPVVVLGESGTGKDVVARAIHEVSCRQGRYVTANVAALPDALIEAELFGHAKGAFTGAVSARNGLFQSAHEGTLFLDEIGEMPLSGQAKLLRALEDGTVRPVGSDQEVPVSPRFVFATCADLEGLVDQRRFRLDLFHRITVLCIRLPPLRERRGDIPALAAAFFSRKELELGRRFLAPASAELLMAQPWPGNVRQLFSALYTACARTKSELLSPGHFTLPSVRYPAMALEPKAALALLDSLGSVSAAARAANMPRTSFRALVAKARGM